MVRDFAELTTSAIVRKDTLVSAVSFLSATMPAKTTECAKSCRMTTAQQLINATVRNMRRERSAKNRRAMTLNAKTAESVSSTKLEGHFVSVRIYGSVNSAKRTRRSIYAGWKHLMGFWNLKRGAIFSQFVITKPECGIISRSRRSKTASGMFSSFFF